MVIGGAYTRKFGYISLDYGIIQVVSVILIGVYSFITANTIKRNFEQVYADLSRLSGKMKTGILDIHTELEKPFLKCPY